MRIGIELPNKGSVAAQPGSVNGAYGNGNSQNAGWKTPSPAGWGEHPICKQRNVMCASGDYSQQSPEEKVDDIVVGDTCSLWTGCKFGNGATAETFSAVLDLGVGFLPGGDLARCTFWDDCDAVDWTLAVVGIAPGGKIVVAAVGGITAAGAAGYTIYKVVQRRKRLDDTASQVDIVNVASGVGTKRNPNKLSPAPAAEGPHSSFRRGNDGRITNYETYDINPRTGEFGAMKRYRGEGKPHAGVKPPLVERRKSGKGPGARPSISEPAKPWEIPGGGK